MKNIKLLYCILIFLSTPLKGIKNLTISTTIFTPAPLFELHQKSKCNQISMDSIKNSLAPLTVCFYFLINENDIRTNITQNPYITSILIYMTAYYSKQLIMKNEQNKIDQEIIDMMQRVFHFLIIGHGIYNKIIAPSYDQAKTAISINSLTLTTLQLFLNKAHETWLTLFSYYQEHYKYKPLYAYHMNQIDIFETLQASTYEPDILPLITNFYDKNNRTYDYEPILNCLEIKLKKINHKLIRVLPSAYHNNDEK